MTALAELMTAAQFGSLRSGLCEHGYVDGWCPLCAPVLDPATDDAVAAQEPMRWRDVAVKVLLWTLLAVAIWVVWRLFAYQWAETAAAGAPLPLACRGFEIGHQATPPATPAGWWRL